VSLRFVTKNIFLCIRKSIGIDTGLARRHYQPTHRQSPFCIFPRQFYIASESRATLSIDFNKNDSVASGHAPHESLQLTQ
jgi:hypothetical protein